MSSATGAAIWAIVNPVAGSGRAGRVWPAIAGGLRAAGLDITACVTCGPGDGVHCARTAVANGATRLLVVGGDGTLNEVVNGCYPDGTAAAPPALALWPVGTGADFARGLGVTPALALATLQSGVPRAVDLGWAQYHDRRGAARTRAFVNVADLGLGPETSLRVARGSRRLGPVAYLSGALGSIAAYQPARVRVTVDGHLVYAGDAGLVVVANGQFFGGGMHVAPRARLDDSAFDVLVLERTSRRVLASELLPRVYRGTHLRHPAIHFSRGGTVSVMPEEAFPLEVDGEIVGAAPVTFTLAPQALQVLATPS